MTDYTIEHSHYKIADYNNYYYRLLYCSSKVTQVIVTCVYGASVFLRRSQTQFSLMARQTFMNWNVTWLADWSWNLSREVWSTNIKFYFHPIKGTHTHTQVSNRLPNNLSPTYPYRGWIRAFLRHVKHQFNLKLEEGTIRLSSLVFKFPFFVILTKSGCRD